MEIIQEEVDNLNYCRICFNDAQYNIFEDELVVDEKKIKIYIILNNFTFEKLYSPDEYSSSICMNCCDRLFNSYKFMIQVRESEQKLKVEGNDVRRTIKNQNENNLIENVHEISNDAYQDDANDIIDDEVEVKEDQVAEEVKEPPVKKQKQSIIVHDIPDSIVISDYTLIRKNGQNVTIKFSSRLLKLDDNYAFDEYLSLVKHSDEDLIYSCDYCIKAFANCEMLIKHLMSCHVCLICHEIFNSYKDLNSHAKMHSNEKLKCPICRRLFLPTSFRQHVKKQHFLNIPYFITIQPENFNKD